MVIVLSFSEREDIIFCARDFETLRRATKKFSLAHGDITRSKKSLRRLGSYRWEGRATLGFVLIYNPEQAEKDKIT
jgi:hypothetical protein